MQPDNLDGRFLHMPNYFSGGGGGFYGYDLPVPIFDDFYGRRFDSASSILTETEAAAADEKTLAALRNHKEAEKRRRERINSHLDRLRALIPCTSKTDKATLLAMVVQRVRELNNQTSKFIKQDGGGGAVPSESDEFSVVHADHQSGGAGEFVLRASVCCEDRSELLSELTEVVSSLRLKTLRAEMCSLGGRSRNVLIVSGDGEECAASLHDALKAIVTRSRPADRLKRRRRFEPSSTSFN